MENCLDEREPLLEPFDRTGRGCESSIKRYTYLTAPTDVEGTVEYKCRNSESTYREEGECADIPSRFRQRRRLYGTVVRSHGVDAMEDGHCNDEGKTSMDGNDRSVARNETLWVVHHQSCGCGRPRQRENSSLCSDCEQVRQHFNGGKCLSGVAGGELLMEIIHGLGGGGESARTRDTQLRTTKHVEGEGTPVIYLADSRRGGPETDRRGKRAAATKRSGRIPNGRKTGQGTRHASDRMSQCLSQNEAATDRNGRIPNGRKAGQGKRIMSASDIMSQCLSQNEAATDRKGRIPTVPEGAEQRETRHASDRSSSQRRSRNDKTNGKWSWFLWLLLKMLGLFSRRSVTKARFCHRCYDKKLREVEKGPHCQEKKQLIASSRRKHLTYLRTPEVGVDVDSNPGIPEKEKKKLLRDEITESGSFNLNSFVINHIAFDVDQGYSVDDDDYGKEKNDGRCRICDSLWWDGYGKYVKYTDKSIGLQAWNHRGSGVLSLGLLLVYLALIAYDAFHYGKIYWGKKSHLLQYIQYMSYLIFVASVPILCLCSYVKDATTTGPMQGFSHWPQALDMRYIVRRMQYLNLSERGLPKRRFYVVSIACAVLITLYRLLFYLIICDENPDKFHSYMATFILLLVLPLYAHFCYLLYLMRASFGPQLKLDLDFIRRHIDQLDECRGKMLMTIQDFRALRQLTSGWMVFVMGVLTWSFATQVTWNYVLFSLNFKQTAPLGQKNFWQVQMYINGLIALENLFFLVLPLVAVGGININFVWKRFHYRLTLLQRMRHELFWHRLLQSIREQNPTSNSMRVTLLFTLIGLFVAMRLGDPMPHDQAYNASTIVPV